MMSKYFEHSIRFALVIGNRVCRTFSAATFAACRRFELRSEETAAALLRKVTSMASIANDPGGRKRILFTDRHGQRRTIWLGKVSKKTADETKNRVELINTAAIAGHAIDSDTADWLAKIADWLHEKFAHVGLVT